MRRGAGGQHPLRRSWPTRSATAGCCATTPARSPAIVEQKDATDEQAAVREINSGILAFDAAFLDDALPRLTNDNAKGEYYLTDTVALAREDGLARRAPSPIDDVLQTEGANDRVAARRARDGEEPPHPRPLDARRRHDHRPRHHLDRRRRAGSRRDVTILPGVQLLGATVVAEDAVDRAGLHAQGRRGGRGGARRTHPRRARRRSAPAPPSGRSPTCGPAPSSAPAARSARSSRPRTPGSARAPRCRTCPTSATPRSARAPTSAPARSSPTTTASQKHRTVVGRHARTASNNTFVAPVHDRRRRRHRRRQRDPRGRPARRAGRQRRPAAQHRGLGAAQARRDRQATAAEAAGATERRHPEFRPTAERWVTIGVAPAPPARSRSRTA